MSGWKCWAGLKVLEIDLYDSYLNSEMEFNTLLKFFDFNFLQFNDEFYSFCDFLLIY